jgi:uncharacterized protein
MLIRDQIEVAQPLDVVWAFFDDIPSVAACLPGANLSEQVGDDEYTGDVTIQTGPVKLEFDGTAAVRERDDAAKTIVVDAAGADRKGRGQAALVLEAGLVPVGGGTRVDVALDLSLSGAAAQYGRGMIADVTAVLLADFSSNMQRRLDAVAKGLDPATVGRAEAASGLSIAIRAARLALARVFRRFFLPYRPQPTGR